MIAQLTGVYFHVCWVNLVCRGKPEASQCYDDAIVMSQRNRRHIRLVKDS